MIDTTETARRDTTVIVQTGFLTLSVLRAPTATATSGTTVPTGLAARNVRDLLSASQMYRVTANLRGHGLAVPVGIAPTESPAKTSLSSANMMAEMDQTGRADTTLMAEEEDVAEVVVEVGSRGG